MSSQFGIYPLRGVQIPSGYCNPPLTPLVTVVGDIATLSWVLPHDVLYTRLQITKTLGIGSVLVLDQQVTSTLYTVQLDPNSAFTWQLTSVCDNSPRTSTILAGPGFNTGNHVIQCLPINSSDVVSLLGVDSVQLSWPSNADSISYTVYFRIKGLILPWDTATTQTNNITLQGLASNRLYEYYIDRNTSDGKVCSSDHGSFTTPVDNNLCPQAKPSVLINGSSALVVWDPQGVPDFDLFLDAALVVPNYPGNLFTFNNLPLGLHIVSVVGKCAIGNAVAGAISFNIAAPGCQPVTVVGTPSYAGASFTQSWTPVAGATGYRVVINGVPIDVVGPSITYVGVPGQSYKLSIYTLCASGVGTQSAFAAVTIPFVCLAPPLSSLVINPRAQGVDVNWPDIPGVVSYSYRYQLGGGAFSSWTPEFTLSTFTQNGLVPLSVYNFQLRSTCFDGTTAVLPFTINTVALVAGTIPVITVINQITDTSAFMRFKVGNKFFGSYQIELTNVDLNTVAPLIPDKVLLYSFSNLIQNTNYRVRVSEVLADTTPNWSLPWNFKTCYTAETLTPAAVFNGVGDIVVTWNLTNALTYQLWSTDPTVQGAVPKLETTLAAGIATYTIIGNLFKFKTLQLIGNYIPFCPVSTANFSVACPQVQNIAVTVQGDAANVTWDDIPGVYGYIITFASLVDGIRQEKVYGVHSINVTGLNPIQAYSVTVKAQCVGTSLGPDSAAITFTTGSANDADNGCVLPIFHAVVQDSSLTVPAGSGTDVNNSAEAIINYSTDLPDAFNRTIQFTTAPAPLGVPQDISGYTFEMDIYDRTMTNILVLTSANGYIINGGTSGIITLSVPTAVMALLPLGNFNYILKWTPVAGATKEIIHGTFSIYPAGTH